MPLMLTIDGAAIVDIPSLYTELNRVFMENVDWTLGESLDALDDMLYGGYGTLHGHQHAVVVWRDAQASRAALGTAATRQWLLHKLQQPGTFNTALIARQLDALADGTGPTYFELIEQVFADHPDIELRYA